MVTKAANFPDPWRDVLDFDGEPTALCVDGESTDYFDKRVAASELANHLVANRSPNGFVTVGFETAEGMRAVTATPDVIAGAILIASRFKFFAAAAAETERGAE